MCDSGRCQPFDMIALGGDSQEHPLVKICIPLVCCGFKVEACGRHPTGKGDCEGVEYFGKNCGTHFYSYEKIWKNFAVDKIHLK